jgi:hypothetical protein
MKVLTHKTYRLVPGSPQNEMLQQELGKHHTEITPTFNREGFYLQGGNCWFEVNGKAYIGDKNQFLYKLQTLNDNEKGTEVYRALKALQRVAKLTKEQAEFCDRYKLILDTRKRRNWNDD